MPTVPTLREWAPLPAQGEARPVAFRPHFVKDVGVGATMTAVLAVGCLIFGLRWLAVAAVLFGLVGIVYILVSAVVGSLTIGEYELVRRRWWGGVRRTPYADVATIVYLPKYGERNQSGEVHYPYLVLLDATGHRLHKLKRVDWTERQLETVGALVPATTKLVIPDFVDTAGLRTLEQRLPGIRGR